MRAGGSGKGGKGGGRREGGREGGSGGGGAAPIHRDTDTPIHRAILPAQIGVSAYRRICLLDRRIGVSAHLLLDRRIGVSAYFSPGPAYRRAAYRRMRVLA